MEQHILIHHIIEEGYLPSPDLLEDTTLNIPSLLTTLHQHLFSKEKPVILHKDLSLLLLHKKTLDLNWHEFEKSRVIYEQGKNKHIYTAFLDFLQKSPHTSPQDAVQVIPPSFPPIPPKIQSQPLPLTPTLSPPTTVAVLTTYSFEGKKREVKDFVTYFKHRYEFLKKLLQQRVELQDVISFNRALRRDPMQPVSVIGLVYDRDHTAKGNLLFTLEDTTGSLKVLFNRNNSKLFTLGEHICPDEVIGVRGKIKGNIIFCEQVFFPDLPQPSGTSKHAEDEVHAAFISDIHFGSKKFLQEEFSRFVSWLNGDVGTVKQREMGKKVRYLFIIGDVVDGVGVYPGQEQDLLLLDIQQQYQLAADLLSQIRKDVQIILCPGQHDAVRAAEPQPPLEETYAEPLCRLPNLLHVSNPCMVTIHKMPGFEGFHVLMYHGASFHYYIDNVPALRLHKARDNPGQVLRLLLQKRHLSPSHNASVYTPATEMDPLLVTQVPDILVSGDMHKSDLSEYNGVIIINCSCWQAKTDFQEKTGNNPDPCKVPLFNLKTREVRIINFSTPQLE